ncbi:CYTH domain-containing protein [Kineothrix alysoides]|uniref:CYTH domain-containing protein n=2 Tax=Kineothrix alysoides TaxID=1469948 RepID=A0A4R1QR07_9FIRM|nr:CYTH domain-containing protein [Kineothrix alysoides]TCL55431.1 CYTH domain-containing protein [Kineothrix alysoides]
MNGMEIERKFTIKKLPDNLSSYPSHHIEQAYLNVNPVVRVRKQDEEYYLTYKGKGLLAREEYNLPLNKESYYHMRKKCDGNIISKRRYLIPIDGSSLTIELDIFDAPHAPLIIAEVEFSSEEEAKSFLPPEWLGEDVTYDHRYHNSNLI